MMVLGSRSKTVKDSEQRCSGVDNYLYYYTIDFLHFLDINAGSTSGNLSIPVRTEQLRIMYQCVDSSM